MSITALIIWGAIGLLFGGLFGALISIIAYLVITFIIIPLFEAIIRVLEH